MIVDLLASPAVAGFSVSKIRGQGPQPVQRDRVEVEQVAGQDRLGLRVEELRPGRPGRRGDGSMPAAWRIFHTVEAPIW